jgi:short-subunit dehydrogenase
MSHRFLELGANVVICGRREDVLEQTAEELTKETGAEIETVRCDVRLPDAVEAMMDRIWQSARSTSS